MNRLHRLLAASAIAFALALALAFSTEPFPGDTDTAGGALDRLNVVLILTDDERADIDRLPSVQRYLATQGMTFTRAFATTPSCCPARAGILSGQYSHTNGVLENSGLAGYPAFDESSTLAVWLREAGYETALVGKYLNGYSVYGDHLIPPGWSQWQAIDSAPFQRYYNYVLNGNGRLYRYGGAPSHYSTTVLTGKAVRFVRDARPPFFLYFAPLAPHLPATPPPRRRNEERQLPPPLERPPSFNEPDVSDKPWRQWHPRPLRPGATRYIENSIRKRQLESLAPLDRGVSEIVETLKRRGLLQRTVIIYASDNGFLWGEHRLGGKTWPYEESIRVPLVVRTPWRSAWGTTSTKLVLNIDLASTIAELAGVAPGLPQDGRSIVPLLRGADIPWRSDFVVEHLGMEMLRRGGPPPYRALRARQYLYVEYLNGWRELYDLARDPWQLRNVAAYPGYLEVRRRLARRLETLSQAPPGTGP